jgi:hypothetical protein
VAAICVGATRAWKIASEAELAAELRAFLDRDDAQPADAARAREALGLLGG